MAELCQTDEWVNMDHPKEAHVRKVVSAEVNTWIVLTTIKLLSAAPSSSGSTEDRMISRMTYRSDKISWRVFRAGERQRQPPHWGKRTRLFDRSPWLFTVKAINCRILRGYKGRKNG